MKKAILKIIFISSILTISVNNIWSNPGYANQTDDKHINVVVIDAGHGGKDFGASVGQAREKDIVLDLALRLGKSIKANYPDVKVIYTRTDDTFIPLYTRANIANKNKADLFISIHVNGTAKTSVQGTETFVLGDHRSKDNLEIVHKENSVILLEDDYKTTYEEYDPNSTESEIMFESVQNEYLEQSIMFASEIQTQFRQNAKRMDRSVKQAGFLVLRQTTMPSVLVEVGFISHSKERSYLMSESGKSAISNSILIAFNEYKRKIENKSNFTIHTGTNGTENYTEPKVALARAKTIENSNETEIRNLFYSVQIGASKKKLDPSPSNFKGEKNVFRMESKEIIRYYSGRFANYEDAVNEKDRISQKFPDSFVVAFENNELISVKNALGKM